MPAIFTWIAGAAGSLWTKLAIIGAIVAAVILVLFRVYRAGRIVERAEQMEKINAAVKDSNRNDAGWRALPADDRRRRLREQRDQLRRLLRPQ